MPLTTRPFKRNENVVESKIKCSKCNSSHLIITEVWRGSAIEWEQIDGKFDLSDGNLCPDGYPYRVECRCKECGHKWKVRKATQIGDIHK